MRVLMPALTVLCLLLAGCGGADDTTAVTDGETAADSAAVEDAPADAPAAGAVDAAACEEIATAFEQLGTIVSSATTGSVDPAEVEAQVAELSTLSESLPAEIADDFDVLASSYGEIATTLSEAGIEPGSAPGPEAQAALQELGTSLSAPELTEATTNVSTYLAGGCQ